MNAAIHRPDPHGSLERDLAALTGLAPGHAADPIWAAALGSLGGPAPRTGPMFGFARKPLGPAATALVTLCVVALLIGISLPALGKARSSVPRGTVSSRVAESRHALDQSRGASPSDAPPLASAAPISRPTPESADRSALDRQVIRKATVELDVPDVHAAFMKAQMLVSEAQGEYVQESSLSGEDAAARASMIIRVAADRLSTVLNGLRTLGVVRVETASGEDVTDQVVDVEARIRNEARVEAELLALLGSRDDAPLKDVLELRAKIGEVRAGIERMTAQRERLGRLVALATVAVILRHEDADAGRARALGLRVADGARVGERSLRPHRVDRVLVRVLVGGAVWWLLLGAALAIAAAAHRRARRRATHEPAPALTP